MAGALLFKGPEKKIIPALACFMARLVRYIHPRTFRYAQVDVPCRQTINRCNLVELFLTVPPRRSGPLHWDPIWRRPLSSFLDTLVVFVIRRIIKIRYIEYFRSIRIERDPSGCPNLFVYHIQ